jgi:hypothetical protein
MGRSPTTLTIVWSFLITYLPTPSFIYRHTEQSAYQVPPTYK